MRESTTYQQILAEGRDQGRVEGARSVLLRQGRRKFGPPDQATEALLAGIDDLDRLERLGERLVEVSTWQELLTGP
jgi:hypothetical protein